jgi:hypothetical protein
LNSVFVAVTLDVPLTISKVGKQKYYLLVSFEVITAVIIHIFIFWVVTPCSFIAVYGHFGGKYAATYRVEVLRKVGADSLTRLLLSWHLALFGLSTKL